MPRTLTWPWSAGPRPWSWPARQQQAQPPPPGSYPLLQKPCPPVPAQTLPRVQLRWRCSLTAHTCLWDCPLKWHQEIMVPLWRHLGGLCSVGSRDTVLLITFFVSLSACFLSWEYKWSPLSPNSTLTWTCLSVFVSIRFPLLNTMDSSFELHYCSIICINSHGTLHKCTYLHGSVFASFRSKQLSSHDLKAKNSWHKLRCSKDVCWTNARLYILISSFFISNLN